MVKDAGTNERLQEVAKEWDLPALLQENPCQAGQEPRTTLASTVEALIGAVWEDCDRNLADVQGVIRLLQG
jgi:ribonuclease-3